jgi:transposase
MSKVRFVGLDVHKSSIVIAVADSDRSEPSVVCEIPHDVPRLVKELRKLARGGAEIRACYEAGPTGFGLYRALLEAKIDCQVIAPSLIPKQPGAQVKTDRRDAVRLARFHRSGDLTTVYVPDSQTEAMRDLERTRDDAKNAERVARHQLSKFLLRHGRHYAKKGTWTEPHSPGSELRSSSMKRKTECLLTTLTRSRRPRRASHGSTRTSRLSWRRGARSRS